MASDSGVGPKDGFLEVVDSVVEFVGRGAFLVEHDGEGVGKGADILVKLGLVGVRGVIGEDILELFFRDRGVVHG